MVVDMDADGRGRRRCNIFFANATQFPNGKLHCPIIPGTSLEEDIASSERASEFPSFLLYLYDDLIDALRHFSRAYKDPCPAKTEGTFPSKMIVAHLMIGFGEEIIAEPKTCPPARSLQPYLTTRFASSSAPSPRLGTECRCKEIDHSRAPD